MAIARADPGKLATSAVAWLAYLVMLAPIGAIVWLSLFDSDIIAIPPPGYSLRSYQSMFASGNFIASFRLSLIVAVGATLISVALGTLASIGIVRGRFPGSGILASIFLAPLAVPAIVLGLAIYIFFFRAGAAIGIRIAGTITSLILAHVVLTLPWTIRFTSAGLATIDKNLEDAAMTLGAPPIRTFLHVTFPLMRASLVAAAIFAFLTSYNALEMSLFLVGPGMTTVPIVLLQRVSWNFDPSVAAMATVQVAISAVALILLARLVGAERIFGVQRHN
jgi:putative spermidine/putrescine transport system permease protein